MGSPIDQWEDGDALELINCSNSIKQTNAGSSGTIAGSLTNQLSHGVEMTRWTDCIVRASRHPSPHFAGLTPSYIGVGEGQLIRLVFVRRSLSEMNLAVSEGFSLE